MIIEIVDFLPSINDYLTTYGLFNKKVIVQLLWGLVSIKWIAVIFLTWAGVSHSLNTNSTTNLTKP